MISDFERVSFLRFSIVLATAIVLLAGSCKSEKLTAVWTTTPMQIDGSSEDWAGISLTVLKDNGPRVALANDSTNLYVLVRFADRQWARMIRRTGMTIQLTPKGLDGPYFQIRYRRGPDFREQDTTFSGRQGERRQTGPPEERMFPGVDSGDIFTCMVKDRIVEMPIPPDGANGPKAGFGMEKGLFTYEFMIPLAESVVRFYGLHAVPGQEVKIRAAWGGIERPHRSRPEGSEGGGFGGGPPGGMGGGFPGGGMEGGPRSERMMQRPEKQEFKITARLAVPDQE